MTNTPTQHLTEEQFDDFLLGEATAEAHVDVADCAACRMQIDRFGETMTAFNETTMAWAQAKSNTISRDLSTATISTAGRTQPLAWATGGDDGCGSGLWC